MKWLDDIVNTFQDANKDILVSSGASPSGVYHVGHLREIVIADARSAGAEASGHSGAPRSRFRQPRRLS